MQNEAQYDLDRKAAEISTLSSNDFWSIIEQIIFEHSALGKIFNKGLDKDDKKEGLKS